MVRHFDIVPFDVSSRRYNAATYVAEVSDLPETAAEAVVTGVAAVDAASGVADLDSDCDVDAVKYWVANPFDLESQTHSTRSVTGV